MRKFPFTELHGVAVHGTFCGPVLVGGLSAPTQGLHFLVLLPLNYLIIFTLFWCNHCTLLEGAPNCAQISIHGRARHCSTWSILRARNGRWACCTNARFTFLGSPSHSFLFTCTLVWCSRCTVVEGAPKCTQFSILGPIRHSSTRRFCGPVQVGVLSPPIKGLHI